MSLDKRLEVKTKKLSGNMTQKTYITAFFLLNALIPFIAVDVPRGLAYASGVIGLVFFALHAFAFQERPKLSLRTTYFVSAVFLLAALSLSWAFSFDKSLDKVQKLALLLPPQVLLISLALNLKKEALKDHAYIFSCGVALSGVFLCFEIITGGAIFNLIRGNEVGAEVGLFEFNRAATLLTIYSFPAIALLRIHTKHNYSFLIILLPLLGVLFMTESQSSQLAFVVGACCFFLFPYRSKLAWIGLKILIVAFMLSAPFLASFAYQNFAGLLESLPILPNAYAGHRLEIWDYVGRYAMQEPLHGYGISATSMIKDFDSSQTFANGNLTIHPHNFAIQIWIEFGLIGITLASGFMYYLVNTIHKSFNLAQQRIVITAFMVTMVPASASFGLWQGWWVATLFHIAAITIITSTIVKDEQTEETNLKVATV